jgi:tetratricopeptide (TPR) repeat protein
MSQMIRLLLSAVLVPALLGAPLAFAQDEPPQAPPQQEEPPAAPEQTEAPSPQPEMAAATAAPTAESAAAYERSLRLYRNRNFTGALQELSIVAAAEPNRADVLYLMGYCHYVLKHFEDSLNAFRRTFEVDPNFDPRGIYKPQYRQTGS